MATQRSIDMHGGVVYFTVDQLNDPAVCEFAVHPRPEDLKAVFSSNSELVDMSIRIVSAREVKFALAVEAQRDDVATFTLTTDKC